MFVSVYQLASSWSCIRGVATNVCEPKCEVNYSGTYAYINGKEDDEEKKKRIFIIRIH